VTRREMEDAIVKQGKLIEGLEKTLADLLNGGRFIAVSQGPAPEIARELHGSESWSTRGRDGDDSTIPTGAILADHTSRCPGCNGAIRKGDLISKVPSDALYLGGAWVHPECLPEPETEAAA
jgi:hypothetical protein